MDAMNSIEMMDPRMDTGIKQPHPKGSMFDPQTSLEPEEICWVMDEMLALEVSRDHFRGVASDLMI